MRRFPVAVSIIGVQVYVMAATNWNVDLSRQLRRHFAFGWHDLVHLQLWRLVTSPFVPDGRGFAWANLLVLVPVLFIAERRFGSTWTAILFTLGDLLSTVAVVVGARLAGAWGSTAALHAALERDGGSSSAGFALVAACVSSLQRDRVRYPAIVGLVVLAGLVAVIHRAEADVQHFAAVVCGLCLAAAFNRRLAPNE